jgi:ribosome-associated toxin RatA of RatAB toxin-antitoxin module
VVRGTARRDTTLIFLLWLIWPCVPIAAAEITILTARHGDSFEVEATAEIDADVTEAWKVLTDYDRLSRFIPGMLESRVVSRDGLRVVVDQRGEAGFLFLTFPIRVRLSIKERPYDSIVSTAISGNFKELTGAYYLHVLETGLRLHYVGRFTPDFGFPPLLGTLIVRSTAQKRFAAMVSEIEKTRRR